MINVILALIYGGLIGSWLTIKAKQFFYVLVLRKLKKKILPLKADKKITCKTTHSWMEAAVLNGEGYDIRKICKVCGLVEGTDLAMPLETVDILEEELQVKLIEEGLYKEFLQKEDEGIKKFFKKEIDAGLDLQRLLRIHAAGMTFMNRFENFKALKENSIKEQLYRSNA